MNVEKYKINMTMKSFHVLNKKKIKKRKQDRSTQQQSKNRKHKTCNVEFQPLFSMRMTFVIFIYDMKMKCFMVKIDIHPQHSH